MCSSIAGLLAVLVSLVIGSEAQQLDPVANMCVRFDHQATVKNGMLYVDGGVETFINMVNNNSYDHKGKITVGFNEYLIAINLTTSPDFSNVGERILSKTASPTSGTPPLLVRGALYQGTVNDSNIYLYGGTTSWINTSFPGFQSPTPSTYSLWSYNTRSNAWGQYDISSASPYRPNSGAYAEAPDQGLAFYFNGQIDSGSSTGTQHLGDSVKPFLTGMMVIDTKQQSARNISTAAVSGDQPRTRGRMQYIPGIGEKGILVMVGGSYKELTELDSVEIGNLVPMDEIDIFDVASLYNTSTPNGTWYKQKASGTVPNGRVDSCLVVASAPDSSSHNMLVISFPLLPTTDVDFLLSHSYMYGGRGPSSLYYDDVYVLSLPSFTWTKVYSGDSPRFGHTCHLVGSRTMITVGGASNINAISGVGPCDWQVKGVNYLDMSSVSWGGVYDAQAPAYEVPKQIVSSIGGSKEGNATMQEPSSGYSQAGLAQLFGVQVMSPTLPSTSTTSQGAIVGGCIGGVAVLLLLVGAVWLIERPKNKQPESKLEGPFEMAGTTSHRYVGTDANHQ